MALKQWEVDKAAGKVSSKEKPSQEKLETPVPRPKTADIADEVDSEQEESKRSGVDNDEDDE